MSAKRNRQRGKEVERAIARRLNGRRVGLMGGEDVAHDRFSVEVKSRQKFAGEAFMAQAKRNAPEGKIPVAVVHVHGKAHDNDLVMVRLQDFERLLE